MTTPLRLCRPVGQRRRDGVQDSTVVTAGKTVPFVTASGSVPS
ncbi:hypothetical protein [Sphingomonas sp. CFBP 8760]|nr:hypothetical protein [Sphingomonas sp. CFBP 8760]